MKKSKDNIKNSLLIEMATSPIKIIVGVLIAIISAVLLQMLNPKEMLQQSSDFSETDNGSIDQDSNDYKYVRETFTSSQTGDNFIFVTSYTVADPFHPLQSITYYVYDVRVVNNDK